jgi:hypothetical protein
VILPDPPLLGPRMVHGETDKERRFVEHFPANYL